MKRNNPIKFLDDNIAKIEIDYNKANDNSKESFKTFYQKLIVTIQKLLKILDNEKEIEKLLTNFCSNYSIKKKAFVRHWLIEIFDNDILFYHILMYLTLKEKEEYKKYKNDERYDIPPIGNNLAHVRNIWLFEKKFGLLNKKSYIDKKKFLEEFIQKCLEAYSSNLSNVSAFDRDSRNASFYGISDIEFYNELIETTEKELELLNEQDNTRLFEQNNFSYFINEDILSQFYSILKDNWLIDDEDGNRLQRLLKFGTSHDRKIKLNLTSVKTAHTFYQLVENKLIAITTSFELAKWLYENFEFKDRSGGYSKVRQDSIRSYIDERRRNDKGQEIIKIKRVEIKAKNGPAFTIHSIYDSNFSN